MANVIATGTFTKSEQKLRWFIVGWITLSTILNLIDRQTLSILAPTLRDKFNLTNQDYSNIVNAFLFAYTIMYTVMGRFVDKVGEKLGMMVCIVWWSIATMLHSLARSGLSLGLFRFLLGIGEPGNYPAALRVTTRWFAKKERGLPIAIFSSGSSVGSLIAVPLIAFLTLHFGWRMAFFFPGFLGLIWVAVWMAVYRHPRTQAVAQGLRSQSSVSAAKKESVPSWMSLVRNKQVRAIVLARLVSDPVWYFYQFWIPKYLSDTWKFDLKSIGLYAWIPFVFGGMGGVLGGMASDWLIRRGFVPAAARKRVLYIAGVVAPLGALTGFAGSPGVAIALIALMAFVVYIWFINTAALISDVFPENTVGSILGMMGTAGSLGGVILTWLVGRLLDHFSSYTPVFIIIGTGHLIASIILFCFMKTKEGEVQF